MARRDSALPLDKRSAPRQASAKMQHCSPNRAPHRRSALPIAKTGCLNPANSTMCTVRRGYSSSLKKPDLVYAAAVSPEPEDQSVPQPQAASGSASRVRLLIVDDDSISATLVFHLAAMLGYEAVVETDAREAVTRALAERFDIVLLDLSMPRLDGFAALKLLREHEALARRAALPVVAVTGYASNEDRLRCLTAGFADHLSKPVHATSLKAMIERIAGIQRSSAAAIAVAETDAERLRATVRRLGSVRPDDRAFAPTVTESFALRSAQLIEALGTAIRNRDTDDVARQAVALRTSAEYLGAMRLATMTEALERH